MGIPPKCSVRAFTLACLGFGVVVLEVRLLDPSLGSGPNELGRFFFSLAADRASRLLMPESSRSNEPFNGPSDDGRFFFFFVGLTAIMLSVTLVASRLGRDTGLLVVSPREARRIFCFARGVWGSSPTTSLDLLLDFLGLGDSSTGIEELVDNLLLGRTLPLPEGVLGVVGAWRAGSEFTLGNVFDLSLLDDGLAETPKYALAPDNKLILRCLVLGVIGGSSIISARGGDDDYVFMQLLSNAVKPTDSTGDLQSVPAQYTLAALFVADNESEAVGTNTAAATANCTLCSYE